MEERTNELGVKNDSGKLPVGIVIQRQFPKALKRISEASEYGHIKYRETDYDYLNAQRVDNKRDRYLNAMFRHLLDSGVNLENKDPETGIEHLVHAVWNGLQLLEAIENEREEIG